MKILLTILLIITTNLFGQVQNPIDVYESTLKVGGFATEEYMCGLAEGDQLIFNFEEVDGKELKEVEIIEYPSSSKFMDYKTAKITNKVLNILTTGIYKFRFTNSAIAGRICKFKIQRIPVSEKTKNFNTSVYWHTVDDTTYNDVEEKYLIKADTFINNITDQVAKVHSSTSEQGNKTSFNFILPPNTKVWSYYIGVNQGGQKVFKDATQQLSQSASPLISKIPGYGPLAALALNGISYLTSLQSGESVQYWIVDGANLGLFNSGQRFNCFKKGDVLNDFSKMTSPLNGQYFLCLYNENEFRAIDVTVKITAICVNEQWGIHTVKKMNVNSRKAPYLKN